MHGACVLCGACRSRRRGLLLTAHCLLSTAHCSPSHSSPGGSELAKHTPLQMAVMGGRPRVVARLLDAKADPQAASADGRQLIHIAALAPCEGLVEMLVKRGAQQLGALSPHGWSPLFLSVRGWGYRRLGTLSVPLFLSVRADSASHHCRRVTPLAPIQDWHARCSLHASLTAHTFRRLLGCRVPRRSERTTFRWSRPSTPWARR